MVVTDYLIMEILQACSNGGRDRGQSLYYLLVPRSNALTKAQLAARRPAHWLGSLSHCFRIHALLQVVQKVGNTIHVPLVLIRQK